MPGTSFAAALVLTIAQSAGDTLVVVANNAPVWGESPALVEEVRIGVRNGDLRYVFGEISDIYVDADGVIWVSDVLEAKIRRYTPDGLHLDDIGREGDGPGEFRGGMDIGIAGQPDGSVLVYDIHGRRVTHFSADGEYLDRWVPSVGCITRAQPSIVTTDEGATFIRTCRASEGRDFWVEADRTVTGDTLEIPDADVAAFSVRVLPFGTMSPYVPKSLGVMSSQGYLVTARTGDYAFHYPLPDGRTVRIERPWTPVEAVGEEREQFREFYRTRQRQWSALGYSTDPAFDDVPSEKPPFWNFRIDNEGRIWAARHVEGYFQEETRAERRERRRSGMGDIADSPMEWREQLVFDVIEPTGRYMGAITMPSDRARIAFTDDTTVWVVDHGELDEPYVVRYRIEPGG